MATEELNCLERCPPIQLEKQLKEGSRSVQNREIRAKKTPDRRGPEQSKVK
jgi:hypothetical protein